jgi:hypothetical protein
MLNMFSFGKTPRDKRVNYLSANWIFRKVNDDGSVLLESPSKYVQDRIVPKHMVKNIHSGWK